MTEINDLDALMFRYRRRSRFDAEEVTALCEGIGLDYQPPKHYMTGREFLDMLLDQRLLLMEGKNGNLQEEPDDDAGSVHHDGGPDLSDSVTTDRTESNLS